MITITRKNLLTEYPKIQQSILPKELKREEFDFVIEAFDDDDENIVEFIDTFIEKLNEVLEKPQFKKRQNRQRQKPQNQKRQKRNRQKRLNRLNCPSQSKIKNQKSKIR